MVLLKNWPFLHLLFLNNIGQVNVFYDIVERKNALLGNKNKKFKIRKIYVFAQGLTHGFAQKLAILPSFFFRQYMQGNCVL